VAARRLAQAGLRAALLLCTAAGPAQAQRPGDLAGEVVDLVTGAPLEGARILAGDRVAGSDATGRFRVERLAAGGYAVRAERVGYAGRVLEATVLNGETTHLRIELAPLPLPLPPIRVTATRAPQERGSRVDRAGIERSGARHAAEAIALLPGVVVRTDAGGGPVTVSVRGGPEHAVLVLVDGAPANDPVTGRADLSRIPADRIESVTVVPGAAAARYGPGAGAGVILVETRRAAEPIRLRLEAGSLGERGGGFETRRGGPAGALSLGAGARRVDGGFDYRLPDAAGGGERRRVNADVSEAGGFVGARAPLGGGEADGSVSADRTERGIPGRGFAPTPHARQAATRLAAHARWQRATADAATLVALHAGRESTSFADTAPPFSPPMRERGVATGGGLRLERSHARTGAVRRTHYGAETRAHHVQADALDAVRGTLLGGAFAGAALASPAAPSLELELAGRADALTGTGPFAGHDIAVSWTGGRARVQLAHRSAVTPPSLADQFFREGVGIAPNPDLRPERVPAELELAARVAGAVGELEYAAGAAAFRADVRGLIVWAPDFRFVWSPSNVDVRRRGLDSWVELRLPRAGLDVRAAHAFAAITYDHPYEPDTIQLAYRPRHSGSMAVAWRSGAWHADVRGRYTGTRYPAAARLNALHGYWSWDAAIARHGRIGGWSAAFALRVERLRDERDSLIYGYPEPGRTIRGTLTLRPARAGPPTLAEEP
jgi:vitamin B12 transporter